MFNKSDDIVFKEIVQAEKNILSSILYYYPEICEIIDVDKISVNQFETNSAKRVFQAIYDTELINGKYEPLFVLNSLKRCCLDEHELDECVKYLEELPSDIQYFSIQKNLNLLLENKTKKNLNLFAKNILSTSVSSRNFNDKLESWKTEFLKIISADSSSNYLECRDVVYNYERLIEEFSKSNVNQFLKTEYHTLDQKIKGLLGGQFIVIASRPGVGKTSFAINLIFNNFRNIQKISGEDKQPAIGIFSLEMTNESLLEKLIAIDSQVELKVIQKLLDGKSVPDYEYELIENSKKKLLNINLLFCDEANITIGKILSMIKYWARYYSLKFVVIDYLQLINLPQEDNWNNVNQYQKIGIISRSLKVLSIELKICIVSLAQLNRKLEERRSDEKSPILSDLRESGSIEQDADIVMFLYEKNEKKDLKNKDVEEKKFSDSSEVFLKIAKNRHGPLGNIPFIFDKVRGIYKLPV